MDLTWFNMIQPSEVCLEVLTLQPLFESTLRSEESEQLRDEHAWTAKVWLFWSHQSCQDLLGSRDGLRMIAVGFENFGLVWDYLGSHSGKHMRTVSRSKSWFRRHFPLQTNTPKWVACCSGAFRSSWKDETSRSSVLAPFNSGRKEYPAAQVAAPTATTKKIDRIPNSPTSQPPTAGPMTKADAITAFCTPKNEARVSGRVSLVSAQKQPKQWQTLKCFPFGFGLNNGLYSSISIAFYSYAAIAISISIFYLYLCHSVSISVSIDTVSYATPLFIYFTLLHYHIM